MRFPVLIRFLLPVAALGAAFAESAPPARGSASFRFVTLTPVKDLWVRAEGGKYQAVQTPTGFIGAPVRVSLAGGAGLYTKREGESGSGPGSYAPVCALAAADTPRQLVVLFADAEGGVKAQVIPDTAARFPFGRVLAVNLTGRPLSLNLGGSVCELPAKGGSLCPEPAVRSELGDVAVKLTEPASAGGRVLYATVWPSGAKLRTLAFFYTDRAGRVVVRTVEDPEVKELAEAPEAKKPAEKRTAR